MPSGLRLVMPQELDAVAELLRVADVEAGELRDALGVDGVELHRNAEADRRHDGELVGGVDALDVEGGIGFRVAARLCVLQRELEAHAAGAHLGQDEIAGAVDDARDPLDAVRGKALPQRLDDGDAPAYGGFEGDHNVLLLRRREDFVAVHRQQRLVGGHHMLAVLDRREDQILGNCVPADQLDHDVDLGIAHDGKRVIRDLRRAVDEAARLLHIPIGDRADQDLAARAARDLSLIAGEHGEGAAADGADAEQSCVDGSHSVFLKPKVLIV